MNPQLKAILDAALPVVLTSAAVYFPQWIMSMRARGGRWASAATVVAVVGHFIYQAYVK